MQASVARRLAVAFIALPITLPATAASVQCLMRLTPCVSTQGTKIPSKQAVDLLDRCNEFIAHDIGLRALVLTEQQVIGFARGRITPLVQAYFAYDDLHASPLEFDRNPRARGANYPEIKRACLRLEQDFHNDSKWTR